MLIFWVSLVHFWKIIRIYFIFLVVVFERYKKNEPIILNKYKNRNVERPANIYQNCQIPRTSGSHKVCQQSLCCHFSSCCSRNQPGLFLKQKTYYIVCSIARSKYASTRNWFKLLNCLLFYEYALSIRYTCTCTSAEL